MELNFGFDVNRLRSQDLLDENIQREYTGVNESKDEFREIGIS